MLILDTPAQERWQATGAREKVAARRAEALAQEIAAATVSVNLEDGWDCTSFEQRVGRPLTTDEVARRLKLCNPRLIAERSIRYPELTGLYIERDERDAAGTWIKRKQHLFTMSSGPIMPEMEVAHVRMKRVANPEVVSATAGEKVAREAVHWIEVPEVYDLTRGWRTVLIRCLKAGLVTRGDVEKYFQWSPTHESPNWAKQT